MENEKDKLAPSEITTKEGEVIVLGDPGDSAQWQRTADVIRLVSSAKSTVIDAKLVDGNYPTKDARGQLLTRDDVTSNMSNMNGLPLPEFVRRLRAKRVVALKNKPPKAA